MDNDSISSKLQELFDLFKSGALSKEEYDQLKSQILGAGESQKTETVAKEIQSASVKEPVIEPLLKEESAPEPLSKNVDDSKKQSSKNKAKERIEELPKEDILLPKHELEIVKIPDKPLPKKRGNKIWITSIIAAVLLVLVFLVFKTHIFSGKAGLAGQKEQTVKDVDGNFYIIVKIGTQVWMAENLNVSTFRNGDSLTEAKTPTDWQNAGKEGKPVWCYYENNYEMGAKYGKLYNWFAINDPRGLAPKGWHIPSDNEWNMLSESLGGYEKDGPKMKSINGWQENGNGNNISGFNALPSGSRTEDGTFRGEGYDGEWWTTTMKSSTNVIYRGLSYNYNFLYLNDTQKTNGYSVRCLKD